MPGLLNSFQQIGSDLAHASLKGANLQGLIASRGAALQLPKDVAAAPFRIGLEPGEDQLPLSFKGVFVGTSPAQDPFSPLLLSVQGLESCCWIGDIPHFRKQSYTTLIQGKDAHGDRREVPQGYRGGFLRPW